jgi:hypothetical protein
LFGNKMTFFLLRSISALLEINIYLQVYMLGVRCNSVNFEAERSPGAPNWRDQIDRESFRDLKP